GATINEEGFADGRYATFRFNTNYGRILARDTFVNATVNFQLAQNTLPVFEKFNPGGLDTVPGYRQGKLSTDNGVNAKLELFLPIYRNEKETVLVQVIPFIAFGKGWDNFEFPNPKTNNLFSVGAGVNFRLSDRFRVRLNLGIPFTNKNDFTGDRALSDDGFNFGFEGTILNF
ncbi:MAG: BamA/TamA family outer membrane protein, partial [Prochloraceae cyanobacterium]